MKKLLVLIGTICVALAILGMFLPVLPTTPFLLLAAVCYARGSKRFYRWLMTNRWCGQYIRNYREEKGIPLKQKLFSILLLWLTIGYSVWAISLWWVQLILLAIAGGVTIHLVTIKTFKPEAQNPKLLEEYDSTDEPD
ncbi:MAG: YbaN family protein [Dehalococcoidia bacterium]